MPSDVREDQVDWNSAIRVVGARTHNLQNIDVEIPLGKLTVITGVSGSGKSSLVFDTIFAEGRRRFLSCVSTQVREQLQGVERPEVELIEGLPPVLCVEQRLSGARKRSTVATISDLYDYLRVLYSRVGQLYCPQCRQPVTSQSRSDIVNQAIQCFDQKKVIVLAPLIRGRAGSLRDVFARIVKDGYVRARVDGELVDAAAPPELPKSKPHHIEIVVDRLIMKSGVESRLEESVDLALQLGQGVCILSYESAHGWEDRLYNTQLACATCNTSFPSLEPRSFSFLSALGACPVCEGLGRSPELDDSDAVCGACQGTRLGTLARSVQIDGISITDFCAMSPARAALCVDQWEQRFSRPDEDLSDGSLQATKHLLPEIKTRLRFLEEIGLNYLTLDRGGETLSAGELQRVRLAACLGSELSGVCYLLDEPTAGLHGDDTARLLQSLLRLRDAGNTVLIVEHDLDVVRAADYVIDLGPGAGILGGRVLACGTPQELERNTSSITGKFLKTVRVRKGRRQKANATTSIESLEGHPHIRLVGATLHNLKDVTIAFPLGQIVCVTGPSGSGKSSLVMQTLVPAIRQALGERIPCLGLFRELSGAESLLRLVRVDQAPLGRSARSSPATYSGLWDDVRKVFAKTKESRLRGYTPRNFSLNLPEARCPRCSGRGTLSVEENRFADWQVRCPECDGKRFAAATLSIRFRGQSVADVLEMSLSDAALFFENFPRLAKPLQTFNELGLGYLKVGQPASTLSGGESQRVKLGTELAKSTGLSGSTLFVLDEPTSGLHVADVQQLVAVLSRLVAEGHSVLIIEHNPELIASADYRIDLGPGAGPNGGQVCFSGSQNS